MKDCQQENIFDEQKIFRQMNVKAFFERQAIHDRKNREKRSECYTKAFKDAFSSLLKNDWESARTAINCGFFSRKWLRALLYEEFEWHSRIFEQELPQAEAFYAVFGSSAKNFLKFVQKVREKLPYDKSAAKSYAPFAAFRGSEERYAVHNIKNIAVCATMSAGKSTFVNALLGRDVLPARNEATTAKITSVYDKDGALEMIGFVQKKDGTANCECSSVQLATINDWNERSDVSCIYLQGDLDGIKNNGFIVAVHDTPGTNNSGDKSHHDVTFEFLARHKMDALIFVANATQLCTTDERDMLSELLKKVVSVQGIPVLFILNKADCIDEEKEDISQIVKRYREYLEEIGFKNPEIFPMSAKAARLFKMARNGSEERLTKRENIELKAIESEFVDLEHTGLPKVEEYIQSILEA